MDNQTIKDLLEITKVLMNKGHSFNVEIKINTDTFKISNQKQKGMDSPKQQ